MPERVQRQGIKEEEEHKRLAAISSQAKASGGQEMSFKELME